MKFHVNESINGVTSRVSGFFLGDYKIIIVVYGLLAIIVSLHALLMGPWEAGGVLHTHYNNYIIFKQSYVHLISNQNLYDPHLDEHWDLYKYSPTFALFFGFFNLLPDGLGLPLWNLLNGFCLLLAIRGIPGLETKTKIIILFLLLVELSISMQNSQSNALIGGLIVLAFTFLEDKKYFLATLFITFTVFIKIFGLLAFVLFLFYPQKWKLILYTIFCFMLLTFLPLTVVTFSQLELLYESWISVLIKDRSIEYGISVMGWLSSWLNRGINQNIVVISGLLILLIPYLRFDLHRAYFYRLSMLASVLIWVVIFNHMAESPSYVIAMTGVTIWYFTQPRTTLNTALMVFAFIFTSLSQTDIFPSFQQSDFPFAYPIKAVPCIFIWLKVIADSLVKKADTVVALD